MAKVPPRNKLNGRPLVIYLGFLSDERAKQICYIELKGDIYLKI